MAAVLGLSLCATGSAEAAGTSDGAARQLAERYAPIVMARKLTSVCNTAQEQFAPPTSVDTVLANRSVRLMRSLHQGSVLVRTGPTAADIAGLGPAYYLDLPGNPVNPKCGYARDFQALRAAGHAPAVAYAHIAFEPGERGLALQYWFYYYFNQFNDVHESDWEGIQLAFDASTPEQALSEAPYRIVLFQHAGGEQAGWLDRRVQKDGTHPIVYAAAGSHATYYDSQLYLGNGSHGSGVGCDNTTGPVVATHPRATLLPDRPSTIGPYAWLTYTGHWGQREASFNDGPTGPITKAQWSEPLSWMDGTRTNSPIVPVGSLLGPSVARRFCGAVAGVTLFINLAAGTDIGALPIALLILVIFILLATLLTRWFPAAVEPLGARRRLGQVLLASIRLQWRLRWTMLALALSSILIIATIDLVEYLVLHVFGVRHSGLSFTDSGTTLGAASSAGIFQPLITALTSATAVAMIRNLDRGRPTGPGHAWGAVISRLWRIIAIQVAMFAAIVGLMLTVVGIPYALKKLGDWAYVQQDLLFDDHSVVDAFHGSRGVVRGRWLHSTAYVAVLLLIGEVLPPFLNYGFLFTPISAVWVNAFGAVLFALMVQYAAVGRTLIYLELKAHPAPARARPALRRGARSVTI